MGRRMRLTPAHIYLLLFICTGGYAFITGVDGPASNVEALEGGNVTLLCDTTPDSSSDEFMVLVWYKNNQPIYSFEIPDKQWSEPSFNTSSRLLANIHSQPTSVTITSLMEDDEALYHCRVDFRLSPTRNVGINVSVVVLPSPPFFMDELNNKVTGKVGPYHDGDILSLRCLVIGGRPPPRMSWYSGDTLVDATDGDSDIPSVRENELYLALNRDNAAGLTCRASNTHLAPPIVATLEVELYMAAYNVSIHWVRGTASDALQAGVPALAQCSARGSYPQPEIAWWLNDKHLTRHSNQSWHNTSLTAVSFLELNPTYSDNGATLACVATNPIMASNTGSKGEVVTLNVTYSPMVDVIRLDDDDSANSNIVVELDSLHLKCNNRANPSVVKFTWFFNDIEIKPSSMWGDGISSQELLIKETTRAYVGKYSCSASNSVGETRSDDLSIIIHYPPECTGLGIRLVKETIHCYIKALPAPQTYFWHLQPLNSELQHLTTGSPILSLDQISGPLAETLKVSCEASNGIASQEEKCDRVFSFENLRPSQPHQCDIAYESGEFQMRCIPVENATHYEVSVWRMSDSNSSLVLERRSSVGVDPDRGLVSAGVGTSAGLTGGLVGLQAGIGRVRKGDEAGASACNRYGCSPPLLLRPTDSLLQEADKPWWHVFLQKDVGISLGAVILVAVFVISTVLVVQLSRRSRRKPQPVIQVVPLDDVANYLDNIDHKVHASCSLRSCSSGYSDASGEFAPPVDRRRKPAWERWHKPPPPDVTLTLHRESAV